MPDVQRLAELDPAPHATVFADDPRTVLLELDAGEAMPEHDHPGTDVLFLVLDGRVDLVLDGETHELAARDVVRVDGERRIEPRAVEDATALVVLADRN